jgi:putative ABC transport system permease protein
MIQNWLKVFVYHFKQHKLFSILNVLGLSIGISGLIFAILYWNEEQSYNEWNPEKDKVYEVINDLGDSGKWAWNVAPTAPILEASSKNIESYCYYTAWYSEEILSYNGKKEMIKKIGAAESNFFSYFPFEFIAGNPKTAIQDQSSIAVSEAVAKLFFKDENPIGKQLIYDGKPYAVRGVYRIPGKSSMAPDVMLYLKMDKNSESWGDFNYGLMLKVNSPEKAVAVAKEIEAIYYEHRIRKEAKNMGISEQDFIKKYGKITVSLTSLAKARLGDQISGLVEGKGNYQFLIIMMGLSVLILVLSIVNYVNLATANAIKRAKEIGIRKIIGATKKQIVWQFIFETVLVVCVALILSLMIVELTLPYYNSFLQKDLQLIGSQFYLQLLLIVVVVIALAGIFPSVYVSNFETLKVLKGNFGRSKNGVWLRNGMLILQFCIATFFIIGSYIVYQQVNYMTNKELGYKGDQVLTIPYRSKRDGADFARYKTIQQELQKIKGIKGVGAGTFNFSGNGATSSTGFTYNDNPIQAQNMGIDFDLLKMLNIKLLQGRELTPELASDTINSMLINKTTWEKMGEKDPVGKEIEWNGSKLKVVGIVDDFHLYGLQREIPPMVFFHIKTIPWMQTNINRIYIKVDPQNMDQTIAGLEKFWTQKVDTEYPFKYDFVDKEYARTYETYVKQRNLFSLLNIVVITIALFGLFALASYSIERRIKEIAIRRTLGAETGMLLKNLSTQYIIFCVIGFILAAMPAYYLLNKWLEDFAFRISITILPFIIGFVVLLSLTLLIVLSKAYQATRIDILKYLKYE